MKKIFAILLAAAMLFTLAACGEKKPSDDPLKREGDTSTPSQSAADPGAGDVDIDGILSGNSDTVYGSMSAEEKQAMIEAAKEEGVEITFNADGSTTIVEQDGTIMTQNADGTYTYQDADGGTGQVGGGWPDNEYTKLIPKPELTVTASVVEGDSFTAMFSDATKEQVAAYIEKVKSAGFTENAELEDQEMMGMSLYSYTASNSSGYQIEITLSGGTCGVTLEKP